VVLLIIALLLIGSGCGSYLPEGFESLTAMQPAVESVSPEDGSVVSPDARVEVAFSRSIERSTVDAETLAVVRLEDEAGRDDLIEDVIDGDEGGIVGHYSFADGDRRVSFVPGAALEAGAQYLVVASTRILGANLLPLNQDPGSEPRPFVSDFTVIAEGGGVSGGVSGGAGGPDEPLERIRPSFIMINEILYDAAGSDSNGDVFVELYGEAGGDITGYELVFVNGEDGVVKDTIEMPEETRVPDDGIYVIADAITGSPGATNVAGADYVKNFDPQNGPDCVQLLGGEGELIDALGYGEPIVAIAGNGMACTEGSAAPDVASGMSLSREFGLDLNDNAMDFFAKEEPTPGSL